MNKNIRENIVVVDLDNTLLKLDSFTFLISLCLNKFFFRTFSLKVAKKIKLISPGKFKHLVVHYIFNYLSDDEKSGFIELLIKNMNYQLYEDINQKYSKNCMILILSASPVEYVKLFAQKVGWVGVGSYFDASSGKYIHLHGKGKLDYILNNFPEEKFNYSYAISDSQSDLELLKLFDKYDLLIN